MKKTRAVKQSIFLDVYGSNLAARKWRAKNVFKIIKKFNFKKRKLLRFPFPGAHGCPPVCGRRRGGGDGRGASVG
jgi:hypothetical protein